MSKFIIEIRTKGFTAARKGFKEIEQGSKKAKNATDKQRTATAGLRRQIGALRNNMLLVTFATVGFTRAIGSFVNASRQFEDVKTRLVGLTGGVENAEKAFKAFNEVAATTPFMLDDVVNAGAQLQAFGVNAEVTLRAVTDLAAYMGSTATEAANALGRAFAGGAGAADILRDKGILNIIKDTQGLEDLSKTTLPQFRQALLRTLVDPAARIEGSSERMADTLTGAISNMMDAVVRFQASVGDLFKPSLIEAAKATEAFFRALDIQSLANFTRHIAALGIALTVYNAKALVAMVRTVNFSKALRASVIGLVAVAIDQILKYTGAFQANTTAVNTNSQGIQNATMNMNQYINTLGQSNMVLEKNTELQKVQESLMNKLFVINMQNNGATDQQLKIAQLVLDSEKLLTQAFGDRLVFQKGVSLENGVLALSVNNITNEEDAFLKVVQKGFDIQKTNITQNKDMAMSAQQLGSAFSQVGNNLRQLSDEGLSAERKFAILLKTLGTVLSLGKTTSAGGAAISAFASLFAHTGGLIKNNGIQRFATGGMINSVGGGGGVDNVPIMAQAGEFVMRRSAVERIGIQNLADMNSGGSSSGLTINIAGDMVGDEDHVRTKVLPAIREELRREANA
ncbi:hypothetical protein [uncultured Mediterranean phage uvMED]|nr:hypothetical protein [uncultured Mediterranean phage uvMED]